MKLPNRENAYVTFEKIRYYLISETHPIGKWKAKIFHSYGFNDTNIEFLIKGLLTIVNTEEIEDIVKSVYGTKYVLDGSLQTPEGKFLKVRTIWIIERGKTQPRFVTAYPI